MVKTREVAEVSDAAVDGRARRSRGVGGATSERASRSKAAQRVLDRRSRRERTGGRLAISGRTIAGVPLVIPILGLVVGALALTLVLTTRSAQDSYAIDAVREQNQELQNTVADLKGKADLADSAPALADAAAKLGMVQGTNSAQLIVGPDGRAKLRGKLTPAEGSPLPALNPAPDPVQKIDASKVDDSLGLGGDENGGTQGTTTQTPKPSATTPSTTPPSTTQRSTTQPSTTQRAPRTTQEGRRDVVGPTTNVAPPSTRGGRTTATPPRNTAPAR